MKKKILALALVVILAITAVAGASLAYLTDKDQAVNVMTLGNVAIEQYEKDRWGGAFVQNQNLFPMVDLRGENDPVVVDGLFNDAMKNVIDKMVTVENTGNYAAYVRTIIAFETGIIYKENSTEIYGYMHDEYIGVLSNGLKFLKNEDGTPMIINCNGKQYALAVRVYENALEPGSTTEPSLKQFFLSPNANNEITALFGDTYEILCLSQAVQSAGFETVGAEYALNAGFGKITEATAQAWFVAIYN